MALADPTNFGNQPGYGPLRPGGQPSKELVSNDRPDVRSAESEAQLDSALMCRDLYRGTEAVRDKGDEYLPRAPGEDWQNYDNRLRRSVFYNMFGRSVDGLTGLIFRIAPVFGDDVPAAIVEHWENIDNAGTHGDVFLRDLEADAMTVGHAGILIEYPKTDGLQTRADEMVLRPYWVPIKKEDIMSWRTVVIDGHTMLSQIVLRETTTEPVGTFSEKAVTRYRRLYRGDDMIGWQLLEINEERKVVVVDEGFYPTLSQIPFVEVPTSGRRSLLCSDPPLLDVGYLNIAHYQTWSDYAYSIHKAGVPIFVTSGMDMTDEHGNPIEIVLGPNTGVNIPDPTGSATYVSHDGKSLGATKQALDDLKSDIGTLGLAMLSPQKRMAETAEAKRIDKAASDSALAVTARGIEDAVEQALDIHAEYMRLPDGGSIVINRDFQGAIMAPEVMRAYAELGYTLGLPIDVILRELQTGGRIAADVDLDELAARMAEVMADYEDQEERQQVSRPVEDRQDTRQAFDEE